MKQPENKRRSGRAAARTDKSDKSDKAAKPAKHHPMVEHNPNPELHSPWPPLVWLLVPLLACVVYGVATRGH
jgi:hypothetical protein